MTFRNVNLKQNFPELEKQMADFWEREKIFERSVSERPEEDQFKFYDGPPFATGLPHYGHILASTIKDAIPRYQTMRGKRVERKWGWDCHGLPIENIVEEELALGTKEDILNYGVDKFCKECRGKVGMYITEWKKTIKRLGRFVDMEHSYRTMDLEYMESVWWVFRALWESNLIYESRKSIHYCPRCDTPLSNFEVTQGYRDTTDESAIGKFALLSEEKTFLLAWTTTPWTLPGNVALALGEHIVYEVVESEGERYILAQDLVEKVFEGREYQIIGTRKASELVGQKYLPVFPYFSAGNVPSCAEKINPEDEVEGLWANIYTVQIADFVTTEDGTGIVHIAPAFGEDDFLLAKAKGLPLLRHVRSNGKFTKEVTDFASLEVKPKKDPMQTDRLIVEYLNEHGKLFKSEKFRHSYPFCWRCDSPLINYTAPSWFVRVEEIKAEILKANSQTTWIPSHMKDGRFGKWLEGARDWAVSRNRFWGTPIPIWKCEECGEVHCISSVSELETLANQGVSDLHKHFVDSLTFPCGKCQGTMKRVPEVLDCWFESGSMPYAQFGEKECAKLPADFIAEGLDQTRGWFYTLTVLAAALSSKGKLKYVTQTKPAFSHCVVNGIVLAEDGKKMSKKLKNYPDPELMFEKYGADAVRFYLLNSPVVRAEDLRFSERGVEEVVRKVILPFWNAYGFFTTYANVDGWQPGEKLNPEHELDRWILSELNLLVKNMTLSMDRYELFDATELVAPFLDNLNNWYIRRSRRRFWKSENDGDKAQAYATLYHVLKTLSQVLAPFCPFVSDEVHRNLANVDSVHLTDWPEADEKLIDEKISQETKVLRQIISLGLAVRAQEKIRTRQPLQSATVALPENVDKTFWQPRVKNILCEELNVRNILLAENPEEIAHATIAINARVVGPRLGGKVQELIKLSREGKFVITEKGVEIGGEVLDNQEASIGYTAREGQKVASEGGMVVALDTILTPELVEEGLARDLVRTIQDLRKEANLDVSDRIVLGIAGLSKVVANVQLREYITAETLATELIEENLPVSDASKEVVLEENKLTITLRKS